MYPGASEVGQRILPSTCLYVAMIAMLTSCRCLSPAAAVSICEIAESPRDYVGRTVRVQTTYRGIPRHASELYDRRCPDVRLAIELPEPDQQDNALYAFDAVLEGPIPGVDLRVIRIDVTGLVGWDFREEPMPRGSMGLEEQRGVLRVEKVWSYEVVSPKE